MRRLLALFLVLSPYYLGSCVRRAAPVPGPSEQLAIQRDLDQFVRYWLEPARIPPPTIAFETREVRDGPLVAAITPIRPEDAPWNQWPGDGSRLFNNRAAHVFLLTIHGAGLLQWIPEGTRLEINDPENAIPAARSPDDVLFPLLRAALDQETLVLDGDLVERTRAAGPFRAAYLPLVEQADELSGVLAFPIDDADEQVVALRVTVEVEAADGRHDLVWLYD